ncbi:MAG: hypothetical protein II359_01660 [Clostridia bacterium]|nr:hypothetical protein [Clostridia bacterium]
MKKTVALLVLCLLFVGMLWQALASDRTVSVNELLTVSLSGDVTKGRVYAALYRDGRMIAVKSYAPEELSTVSFDAMQHGDHIKVLWWDAPLLGSVPASEDVAVRAIVDETSHIFLVTTIGGFLQDNQMKNAVYGYYEGSSQEVEIPLADHVIGEDIKGHSMGYEDLDAGDVILFSQNENGEIAHMKRLVCGTDVRECAGGWSREFLDAEGILSTEEYFGYVKKRTTTDACKLYDSPISPSKIWAADLEQEQTIVYYVDLCLANPSVTVGTDFSNVSADNFINSDTGFFVYFRGMYGEEESFEEAVVYMVNCEEMLKEQLNQTAEYAYLHHAGLDKDGRLNLRLMDQKGKWHYYPVAENVRVLYENEMHMSMSTSGFLEFCGAWSGNTIRYQENQLAVQKDVIRYQINSSGEIIFLSFAATPNTQKYSYSNQYYCGLYDANTHTINGFVLPEDALVYTIKANAYDKEENVTVASDVLKDGYAYYGDVYVSPSSKGEAKCMTIYYTDILPTKYPYHYDQFVVVEEVMYTLGADGQPQYALMGYQYGEETLQTWMISKDVQMKDTFGADMDADNIDIFTGDVVSIEQNVTTGELTKIQMLFSAETARDNTPGWYYAYTNADDLEEEEIFGYVAESGTTIAGVDYYNLSAYPFDDNTALENVDRLDRVRSSNLYGSVYYVDLSGRNISITVKSDFSDVKAGNIALDKSGDTLKDGYGYFMYTKIVNGRILDAVVYIVDCADFDLDHYNEKGASLGYIFSVNQEVTGPDADISLTVLDADGTWNTYPVAEQVAVFSGGAFHRAQSRADFAKNAESWTEGGFWYYKKWGKMIACDLFFYKLNANGEISTLIIPTDNEATTGTYGDSFTAVYDAETGMLGDIKITESTVVYAVKNGIENRQDYIKISQKVLKDGETYTGEYLVSVGGDKTVPDAIVVNYTDYSVVDTERFMIVYEASEYENEEGDAQDALDVYQNYEEIWTIFVSPTAKITDRKGNTTDSGRFFGLDLYEGDVIAATLNDELEIEGIRVLFTAEEVLRDSDGFHNTYINADGQTVEEIYGYVAAKEYNAAGNPIFKLSAHPFTEDDISPENVLYIAEIDTAQMDDLLYMVDLSRKNVYFDVYEGYDFDLSLIRPANITLDRDGSTTKKGEGYFMYTKIVDGQVIDMVVYIVDCADFDLSKYSTEQVQ